MDTAQSVTFTYQGVPFTVVYRIATGEGKDLLQVLEETIIAWDVVDEEGAPVAVDRDGIKSLPSDFMLLLLQTLSPHIRVRAGLDEPRE